MNALCRSMIEAEDGLGAAEVVEQPAALDPAPSDTYSKAVPEADARSSTSESR